MPEITIIILAAGESRRFGSPKQAALYKGRPLLKHVTDIALESNAASVVVVFGAHADKLQPLFKNRQVRFIFNKNWHQGLSSSIRTAIQYLQQNFPNRQGVLFMAVDQPNVHSQHLNAMINRFAVTGKRVASSYSGTIGIPALFPVEDFSELSALQGDSGAKKLLKNGTCEQLELLGGELDIDYPEDISLGINSLRR
jgi:molybdenum cofactor cytidylyltransferase